MEECCLELFVDVSGEDWQTICTDGHIAGKQETAGCISPW